MPPTPIIHRLRLEPFQNAVVLVAQRSQVHLKRGDQRPSLSAMLYDPNGDPQPLSGSTVAFRMVDALTRETIIDDAPATIVSPGSSLVRYDWAAADTERVGEFDAWFVEDDGSGKPQSFPNDDAIRVVVEP